MLFFGNVEKELPNDTELANISLYVKVALKQETESLGYLESTYLKQDSDDDGQIEYYNPLNTYYKLGYWPDEIYRLGIVYIMNDDTLSPVYNLRGGVLRKGFHNINEGDDYSVYYKDDLKSKVNYVPKDTFIPGSSNLHSNTKGVFKNYIENIYGSRNEFDIWNKGVYPMYYEISVNSELASELSKYGVKGYFVVRQKRIPTILGQGLSIGVDRYSHAPCLRSNSDGSYFSETITNNRGGLSLTGMNVAKTDDISSSALLFLDANVNPEIQSALDGSKFFLEEVYNLNQFGNTSEQKHNQWTKFGYDEIKLEDEITVESGLTFIPSNTALSYVNDKGYSTKIGSSEEVRQFSFFGKTDGEETSNTDWRITRGLYCPFVGVENILSPSSIYNVKIKNYSSDFLQKYIEIRANDGSPYFAITDRYALDEVENIKAFRGDCFTNTVSIRMIRNFIDSDVPVNETIIDPNCWSDNYNGISTTEEEWTGINRGDTNTKHLGHWVTYKVLSNYNLGLRSIDKSNVDEYALMGNYRSFYPNGSLETNVSSKIEESWKLNSGYNTTLGARYNFLYQDTPYTKDIYDNRVMFSNVQVDDVFRNSYRIFQGLSYKDIDRKYGGITKLIEWGVNLMCVFEHGLAILPINEKALIQTNTNQSIHMYGAGVMQNQISLISPDYGSSWKESIIRTPTGLYGVDTFAKKIWRFSDNKGFEFISDFKVQSFLNDNLSLSEQDVLPEIGLKNVKTHYNKYKGDLIFTFYNEDQKTEWSLCFNERLDKWITRYSWMPLCSENINNLFCSMSKEKSKMLSQIYNNINTTKGLKVIRNTNVWNKRVDENSNSVWRDHICDFEIVGLNLFTGEFDGEILEVKSEYLNSEKESVEVDLNVTDFYYSKGTSQGKYIAGVSIPVRNLTYNDGIEDHSLYYFKIKVKLTATGTTNSITQTLIVVLNYEDLDKLQKEEYKDLISNYLYIHGRAGIFDEEIEISPTKWYDRQEKFEFEFVVNEYTGIQKIFNDISIISNRVKPETLKFEIIGDSYDLNKMGIYKNDEWNPKYNPIRDDFDPNYQISQNFKNTEIVYDKILNQYSLSVIQDMEDMKKSGRIAGNIKYKEDQWNAVIDPIKYDLTYSEDEGRNVITASSGKSIRLRDKFLKIRVIYSGEDLVTILALKTLMTLSYS